MLRFEPIKTALVRVVFRFTSCYVLKASLIRAGRDPPMGLKTAAAPGYREQPGFVKPPKEKKICERLV